MGRYSWNNHRPSLTFTPQFGVIDDGDRDDHHVDPEYWQVSLEMRFGDSPDLMGIDALHKQDTGFCFVAIGADREAALAHMRIDMQRYPQLQAAWRTEPSNSELAIDRTD